MSVSLNDVQQRVHSNCPSQWNNKHTARHLQSGNKTGRSQSFGLIQFQITPHHVSTRPGCIGCRPRVRRARDSRPLR
ncbi:hypothetical protein GN956_G13904 [Arapaima gigas]